MVWLRSRVPSTCPPSPPRPVPVAAPAPDPPPPPLATTVALTAPAGGVAVTTCPQAAGPLQLAATVVPVPAW